MSDQRLRPNPSGDLPNIGNGCWVSSDARIIGRVELADDVSVYPFAVIRSDEMSDDGICGKVYIGSGSNIQDNVAVHALAGTDVHVGEKVSLSHHCIVHGPCSIGDNCFIGFGAIVFQAKLGQNIFVSPGAIIQNVDIPDHLFVPPGARILTTDDVAALRTTTKEEATLAETIATKNKELRIGYRKTNPVFPAHRRSS